MNYAKYASRLAVLFLTLSLISVFAQSSEPEKTSAMSNEEKAAGTSSTVVNAKALFKRESSLMGGLGSDAKVFINGGCFSE